MKEGRIVDAFTDKPGWEIDLRKKFRDFFRAWHIPSDALTPEDRIHLEGSSRKIPKVFVFVLYSDGTPILVNDEAGAPLSHTRRAEMWRQYMRSHYSTYLLIFELTLTNRHAGHAKGILVKSVPWASIIENTDKFFAEGMFPPGLTLKEASKQSESELVSIVRHIMKMENPSDESTPRRFRFKAYEHADKNGRYWVDAVYDPDIRLAPAPQRAAALKDPLYPAHFDFSEPGPSAPKKLSFPTKEARRNAAVASHAAIVAARQQTAGANSSTSRDAESQDTARKAKKGKKAKGREGTGLREPQRPPPRRDIAPDTSARRATFADLDEASTSSEDSKSEPEKDKTDAEQDEFELDPEADESELPEDITASHFYFDSDDDFGSSDGLQDPFDFGDSYSEESSDESPLAGVASGKGKGVARSYSEAEPPSSTPRRLSLKGPSSAGTVVQERLKYLQSLDDHADYYLAMVGRAQAKVRLKYATC